MATAREGIAVGNMNALNGLLVASDERPGAVGPAGRVALQGSAAAELRRLLLAGGTGDRPA